MNRSMHRTFSNWLSTAAIALLMAGGTLKISAIGQESLATTPGNAAKLMREGSRIEASVIKFRAAGERLTAQLADQRTVTALENLAAQRVLKAVIEDPKDDEWKVTGTITEFNNRNFLLLEHVKRGGRK